MAATHQKPPNRKTWLRLHPEDQWIDDENQRARMTGYEDDDIRQLMAAVCIRACIDYKKATSGVIGTKVDGKYAEQTISDCHRFFGEDMMQYFTNGMSISEIERMIRATPAGSIHNLWRKVEDNKGKRFAKETSPIIEE